MAGNRGRGGYHRGGHHRGGRGGGNNHNNHNNHGGHHNTNHNNQPHQQQYGYHNENQNQHHNPYQHHQPQHQQYGRQNTGPHYGGGPQSFARPMKTEKSDYTEMRRVLWPFSSLHIFSDHKSLGPSINGEPAQVDASQEEKMLLFRREMMATPPQMRFQVEQKHQSEFQQARMAMLDTINRFEQSGGYRNKEAWTKGGYHAQQPVAQPHLQPQLQAQFQPQPQPQSLYASPGQPYPPAAGFRGPTNPQPFPSQPLPLPQQQQQQQQLPLWNAQPQHQQFPQQAPQHQQQFAPAMGPMGLSHPLQQPMQPQLLPTPLHSQPPNPQAQQQQQQQQQHQAYSQADLDAWMAPQFADYIPVLIPPPDLQ